MRDAFLRLVNAARASNQNCGNTTYGATAGLTWNVKLASAAAMHSNDMAKNNFLSHTGSNGSTLAARYATAGYTWTMIGENVASGYTTPEAVMQGWLASAGHCANIMNPQFTEIGVACAQGSAAAGNANTRYWTMDLGRPN
jgi:uncharacterized protein YkwD